MAIAVPAGSVLNLRVHGAGHTPGLALDRSTDSDNGFSGANGEYSAAWTVRSNAHVRVRSSGRAIGDWSLTAIPDKPPAIAFTAPPGKTEHDALKLVLQGERRLRRHRVARSSRRTASTRRPLIVDLPLAGTSAKTVAETNFAI